MFFILTHLQRTLIAVFAATIALLLALPRARSEPIKDLTIVIDVSASFALLDNKAFAQRIANDLSPYFDGLSYGSIVTVVTAGEYDPRKNILQQFKVTYRTPPDQVRLTILETIKRIPSLVKSQNSTNLVGALTDISHRLDCQNRAVHVVVLSDAQENSRIYGTLPPAKPPQLFRSCKQFAILGVSGPNPRATDQLIQAWTAWGRQSGFDNVAIRP